MKYKDLFISIIIGIIVVSFAIYLGIFIAKKTCLESYSNFQPEYSIFKSCRIMVDGVMTPIDIVREFK